MTRNLTDVHQIVTMLLPSLFSHIDGFAHAATARAACSRILLARILPDSLREGVGGPDYHYAEGGERNSKARAVMPWQHVLETSSDFFTAKPQGVGT